jgi:hypothetical protein
MGFLNDNIEVIADNRFHYKENSISFMLHFVGLDYEAPLCTIASGVDEPLVGNTDLHANVTNIRHFNETIFFEVVPLEFLLSDAQTPQVIVTIDGMEALCLDLNCDYQYA